jgi:hypothetical protein
MPDATPEPSGAEAAAPAGEIDPQNIAAYVRRVKASWRAHEAAMSWEEKVAAIERMWVRSAQLERARALVNAAVRPEKAD